MLLLEFQEGLLNKMEQDVIKRKFKVVIVSTNFSCGGVEKSLISFMNQLDYDKVDVDLLLKDHTGELRTMVPESVHILPPIESESCREPIKKAIPIMIHNRQYRELIYKILKTAAAKSGLSFLNDKVAIHFLKEQSLYYDLAILYDFTMLSYFERLVEAKKRCIFIHFDAKVLFKDWKIHELRQIEERVSEFDSVFCVSKYCMQALLEVLPRLQHKAKIFHNILDEREILLKAQEGQIGGLDSDDTIKICTVARLSNEKGIDVAISTCYELIKRGYKVTWICVGDGPIKEELQSQIEKMGLADSFYLIGSKPNPYKYMANCDVYVQPSRYESYGITVAEAAILHKKMVLSDIPSFHEIVDNSSNIIFSPTRPIELANSIERMLEVTERTEIGILNNYKSEMDGIYSLLG